MEHQFQYQKHSYIDINLLQYLSQNIERSMLEYRMFTKISNVKVLSVKIASIEILRNYDNCNIREHWYRFKNIEHKNLRYRNNI